MARPPTTELDSALCLALSVRALGLTDDQFLQFCRDNEDFRFEISAEGELIIMAPTSPKTDVRNVKITQRLANWSDEDGTGLAFGSSAMFTLPNGARRSPDGAWILKSRWHSLTEKEKDSITKICPDFLIELRSSSDRLGEIQAKMEEYIDNGARLAWLLDPIDNCATIYRPDASPERIDRPTIIVGEHVLAGFKFDFRELL